MVLQQCACYLRFFFSDHLVPKVDSSKRLITDRRLPLGGWAGAVRLTTYATVVNRIEVLLDAMSNSMLGGSPLTGTSGDSSNPRSDLCGFSTMSHVCL